MAPLSDPLLLSRYYFGLFWVYPHVWRKRNAGNSQFSVNRASAQMLPLLLLLQPLRYFVAAAKRQLSLKNAENLGLQMKQRKSWQIVETLALSIP